MRKLIFAISALALVTSAALADPIADRQALMKANGKAMGALVPMAKGEKPFDAAVVLEALKTLNDNVQKIDVAVLFPAGSDTGAIRPLLRKSGKTWQGSRPRSTSSRQIPPQPLAAPPQDAGGSRRHRRSARRRTAAVATRRSASRKADRWAFGES